MLRPHRLTRSCMIWLLSLLMAVSAVGQAACMVGTSAQSRDGQSWAELCTPAGMQWISLTTGEMRQTPPDVDGAGEDAGEHSLRHCDLCFSSRALVLPEPLAEPVAWQLIPLAVPLPEAQVASLHDVEWRLLGTPPRAPPQS